jgi:hypothetical protein
MFDVFYINQPSGIWPHERQVSTLEEACALSRTRYLWVIDGHNDYSNFDWLWEPVPWEGHQTHVWPSQHQENSQTYLIPKSGISEVNRSHPQLARNQPAPIIGIDHGNGLTIDVDIKTRYISDYLGTLRRVLSKITDPYVWVVSSVCDYSEFDFTWHPSEWQADMLHVFPSNEQKFGDTFYIHVPTFLEKTEKLALLEWFDTIHFVEGISVLRLPVPIVTHRHDTQINSIWEHTFQDPVIQFVCETGAIGERVVPTINLWRTEMKTVMPLSKGASSVIVPREAKNFIKTQVYDYPYIDKSFNNVAHDHPLDIVFIDNGEPNAEENWKHLEWAYKHPRTNRLHRSTGVNGRVAAYQAAARLSKTPWFFAVFAKLRVDNNFDWSWQPDRLQAPKHYIFHAFNPINRLTYGHQAMIAYNKELVLNNPGVGLDFTLDSEHEVVPLLSGTAEYAYTPWMAWRTAFREVLKLKGNTDVESEYRLNRWCANGEGINAQWSSLGAQDAVEYYEEVGGDFAELKKSYDWSWLASYALVKRNLTPGQ